jgi:AcrR family transcriptional regulator
MRKLNPVKFEEKRREILNAAGHCFLRSGLVKVSVSDICTEAGISPGHLYHYFDSKQAIIAQLSELKLKEAAERFKRVANGHASVLAAMLTEIDEVMRPGGPIGYALLFEMLAEASRSPDLAETLRSHSRSVRMLLAEMLRRGQAQGEIETGLDLEIAAALLIGVMDGMKALVLRDSEMDVAKTCGLLRDLVSSFLSPAIKPQINA